MKQFLECLTTLLGVLVFSLLASGFINASTEASAAKSFKADCIAQIENSNFNEDVIQACIQSGKDEGYEVTVNKTFIDAVSDASVAEVVVEYDFRIPLLKITNRHSTRGTAR